MRTLGIDLAAQDRDTAACAIEWRSGGAEVEPPRVGIGDEPLVEAMVAADWVGIDAPFGWPDAMVEAVHGFARGMPWPESAAPERLRYRVTDWAVHDLVARERGTSVWPLSVSSDRIAVCAWRCARLLTEYRERTGWGLDRVGGEVLEVYPAGALAMWGLAHKGYKSRNASTAAAGRDKRAAILAEIERATGRLTGAGGELARSDHGFDAFVSSLVARAAATGQTIAPDREQREPAEREGWIQLPRPDSLAGLAT